MAGYCAIIIKVIGIRLKGVAMNPPRIENVVFSRSSRHWYLRITEEQLQMIAEYKKVRVIRAGDGTLIGVFPKKIAYATVKSNGKQYNYYRLLIPIKANISKDEKYIVEFII